MKSAHRRWYIALTISLLCVALAYALHCLRCPPGEKIASAAEDGVYEAVVRDMLQGSERTTQLVFDESVLTYREGQTNIESCKQSARKAIHLENGKLPYDSLADKIYRLFNGEAYDDAVRSEALQDFAEKSCTGGPLSRTFHTDLPRTFVSSAKLDFNDLIPIGTKDEPFEQRFPGANGVISFSHVGFDGGFDEAIVSASFVCGGLCGHGSGYVLKKLRGRWVVVSGWILWIA